MFINLAAFALPQISRKKLQEIYFTTGSLPQSFDPSLNTSANAQFWSSYLFEGLTRWDKNGKAVLGAAADISFSDDKKTITFKMRDKIFWHDNQPVTSIHFLTAFRRLVSPKILSENSYLVSVLGVKNASLVESGKVSELELGVSAPNNETLVLQLDSPSPFLLEILAMPAFSPSREDLTLKSGDGEPFQSTRRIIGNGPFKVTAFENRSRLRIEKFKTYWDSNKIMPLALEMPVSTNDSLSSARLFETKQLDVVWGIQSDAQNAFSKMKVKILPFKSGAIWYLLPNLKSGSPFERLEVRQKLASEINRDELVHKILRPTQNRATQFLVPTYLKSRSSFLENLVKKIDPHLDLGLKNSISLLGSDSKTGKREAEYFQNSIRKILKTEVKLDLTQASVRYSKIEKGEFDIALASTIPSYPDAYSILCEYFSYSRENSGSYSSKIFDTFLHQAKNSQNSIERMKQLEMAEKVLLQDVAVIPLYESGNIIVLDKQLEGVSGNIFGPNPDFRFAYWKGN